MKREFFGTALCKGESIRYDLLVTSECYGICVEYCDERVELPGLTGDRARAEHLLRVMMRGTVTPATAWDIAEDFLRG